MLVLTGRNVNALYHLGRQNLDTVGMREQSRNGDVLVAPYPVVSVYERPTERVLFSPERDCNPFFHLMEGIWMMAGRADAAFLNTFVKDFGDRYAEPDGNLWGGYGRRWRRWFKWHDVAPVDQLQTIAEMLRRDPSNRRCVIQMWDARYDLDDAAKRDLPCNTQLYPRVRQEFDESVLDLTILCRSNDIVWGAYGANAVHFSMLQEWLAAVVGVGIGKMYQFSNNWHGYTEVLDKFPATECHDLYASGDVRPAPMVTKPDEFLSDCEIFCQDPCAVVDDYDNSWFNRVAVPMAQVHSVFKTGDREWASRLTENVEAPDWQRAAREWIGRRRR
jgi:thymidylate synthase